MLRSTHELTQILCAHPCSRCQLSRRGSTTHASWRSPCTPHSSCCALVTRWGAGARGWSRFKGFELAPARTTPDHGQLDNPTTRQMRLATVPRLLPPPEMSRGIQVIAAREVKGRLLAGLGAARRSNPCVVICSYARTAGRSNRARHTRRLAGRLPPHSSSLPEVNWPGGATARGAERRITPFAPSIAARLVCAGKRSQIGCY